jgi:hypothetical protein
MWRHPTGRTSWFNGYRAMRVAALVLVGVAGFGCRHGTLQDDAGGTGTFGLDGGIPGDGGVGATPITGPGAGDGGAWLPTADNNCGKIGLGKSYLAPEILVVLDRSANANTTFMSAVAAVITKNADDIDWGLYTFPANGSACTDDTVSTTIDLPPLSGAATHVIAHLIAAGTGSGGTPTAAAIDVAAAAMLSRTTVTPKFLLLVTDGAPTCAGRTAPLSADPTQAQVDAVAAIAAAKAAGLPTLVAAPSAATDVAALNALAVAGGYGAPGEIRFATEGTISNWFNPTSGSDSCTASLGVASPPVPDRVSVILDGAMVPRDRSRSMGWDYTDSTQRSITLYGTWCTMWLAERTVKLDIYYGCPNPG